MATVEAPVARERATKPRLIFFTSSLSGQCRRVEGFLAQVLQRRRNHGTFRVVIVNEDERPDLVSQFGVTSVPTLVVVEGRAEQARLERPRGCKEIEALLSPWLH
jgi:thioredoxin-like negative regulator of GroEL